MQQRVGLDDRSAAQEEIDLRIDHWGAVVRLSSDFLSAATLTQRNKAQRTETVPPPFLSDSQ